MNHNRPGLSSGMITFMVIYFRLLILLVVGYVYIFSR